jgi:DUF1365 family protein
MPPLRSCLYRGQVMHHRLRPTRHRFVYEVFSLYLDLDELDQVDRSLHLLSVGRRNLLSFHAADHGPRDGSALRPWVEAQLARHGIVDATARIVLLCFPRLLGYVFNPLSIYFCHGAGGAVRAIVYEVKNTFGEQHCYVFEATPANGRLAHACAKAMYVSPFIGMDARYEFKLRVPDERLLITIFEREPAGPVLTATYTGARRPLTDRELLRALRRNLFMTWKVIAGIHFEALRLWWKGVPYFPRAGAADSGSRIIGGEAGRGG